MRVYNYSSFVKVLCEGIINPNKTKVAQVLFEPVINSKGCLQKNGNPYIIDSKKASMWFNQKVDIPENIKKASETKELYYSIPKYFSDNVFGKLLNSGKTEGMLKSLYELICDSDLTNTEKETLKTFYNNNEYPAFLSRAFLCAIIQNNLKRDSEELEKEIKFNMDAFKRYVEESKKPSPIIPPEDIAPEEMEYVKALYAVYGEKTGTICKKQTDLHNFPRLEKDFDRHRKNYYLAETIRRGLRDTGCFKNSDIFDTVKDEMYEGVVDTEQEEYDCGFDRLSAVMKHATVVQLSRNSENMTLNWIGPGEKKGICHMLVNDKRLNWMGDN